MRQVISHILDIIVGAFIGAIATYLGAVKINKRNSRNIAAIELRKAFLPTLTWLKFTGEDKFGRISNRLATDFDAHSIAIDQFSIYLSGEQLRNYNQAWLNYYGHDAEKFNCFDKSFTHMQYFSKYDGHDGHGKSNGRDMAIQNIEALLAFTSPPHPDYAIYPFPVMIKNKKAWLSVLGIIIALLFTAYMIAR
jgi:hypothetical protein